MLEKLKQFFTRFFWLSPKNNEHHYLPKPNKMDILPDTLHASQNKPSADEAHQLPITNRIKTWLDDQGWRYDHRPPSENASRTHHLILGFTDKNNQDWTCIFRINESNQLVTLFGVIEESIPTYHYAQTMVETSQANMKIGYGNLELDPYDGELRAKVSFDGEFTSISDRALSCYVQAVSGLIDIAYNIIKNTKQNTMFSNNVNDYLEATDEVDVVVDDKHQKFFVATTAKQ